MKKNISLKTWITLLFIVLISIITFRVNGSSVIYTGFLLSILGIFLSGFITNRVMGSVSGGLIIGLGILARKYFPIESNLKDLDLKEFLIKNQAYQEVLYKYIILFIFVGVLIGFLSGLLGEYSKTIKNKQMSAVKITYTAIFIALSVMINSLRVESISFGGFPIILSGYLLGPIQGFTVGAISDILGFIVRPSAFAFNPLFTLTSALTGLLPVFITKLLKEKYPNFSFIKIFVGVLLGQLITSVIMVPIFSSILYGQQTFWVLAAKAFVKQALSIPIYAILIKILNDRLKKVIDFRKEFV